MSEGIVFGDCNNLQTLDDVMELTPDDLTDDDDGASDSRYSSKDDKSLHGNGDMPETDYVDEKQSMYFGNQGVVRELDDTVILQRRADKEAE